MNEIITVERRRRWSDADKRRIVEETLASGASVSAVAKRHGLYPGQVFCWRRSMRKAALGQERAPGSSAFTPVVVQEQPHGPAQLTAAHATQRTTDSRIEIILGRGRRIVVGPDVDAAALRRVLDVLEGR